MKSRWGSVTREISVSINLRLAKNSVCLEYVVVHGLFHFA